MAPRGENRASCKIQEQWERSEEVAENKALHFFDDCKSRAFCVQINTNCASKLAKTTHIAQNAAKISKPQGRIGTMSNTRLHTSASPGSVLEASTIEFDERTGNVYENKGSQSKNDD